MCFIRSYLYFDEGQVKDDSILARAIQFFYPIESSLNQQLRTIGFAMAVGSLSEEAILGKPPSHFSPSNGSGSEQKGEASPQDFHFSVVESVERDLICVVAPVPGHPLRLGLEVQHRENVSDAPRRVIPWSVPQVQSWLRRLIHLCEFAGGARWFDVGGARRVHPCAVKMVHTFSTFLDSLVDDTSEANVSFPSVQRRRCIEVAKQEMRFGFPTFFNHIEAEAASSVYREDSLEEYLAEPPWELLIEFLTQSSNGQAESSSAECRARRRSHSERRSETSSDEPSAVETPSTAPPETDYLLLDAEYLTVLYASVLQPLSSPPKTEMAPPVHPLDLLLAPDSEAALRMETGASPAAEEVTRYRLLSGLRLSALMLLSFTDTHCQKVGKKAPTRGDLDHLLNARTRNTEGHPLTPPQEKTSDLTFSFQFEGKTQTAKVELLDLGVHSLHSHRLRRRRTAAVRDHYSRRRTGSSSAFSEAQSTPAEDYSLHSTVVRISFPALRGDNGEAVPMPPSHPSPVSSLPRLWSVLRPLEALLGASTSPPSTPLVPLRPWICHLELHGASLLFGRVPPCLHEFLDRVLEPTEGPLRHVFTNLLLTSREDFVCSSEAALHMKENPVEVEWSIKVGEVCCGYMHRAVGPVRDWSHPCGTHEKYAEVKMGDSGDYRSMPSSTVVAGEKGRVVQVDLMAWDSLKDTPFFEAMDRCEEMLMNLSEAISL